MAKQSKQNQEDELDLSSNLKQVEQSDLDLGDELPMTAIPKNIPEPTLTSTSKYKHNEEELVNCLINKVVTVRFIPRASNLVQNPKHILYGGLAEHAFREYTVPRLSSSGAYVNVLTNAEKDYLEYALGLEPNALSIHKRVNNFWETFKVRLSRIERQLRLNDPIDYISYKVLKANPDFIASSLEELEERPRASHQFVMIQDNEENKNSLKKLSFSMRAFMLLGKLQDELDILKMIVEIHEGRPTTGVVSAEALLSKVHDLISADAKGFVKIAEDPLLSNKVLLKKAVETGLVSKRGTYYYRATDNTPLCLNGEEPTLTVAAKFLSMPKNQEFKFLLEAKTNQ